jgi:hypothetical protein
MINQRTGTGLVAHDLMQPKRALTSRLMGCAAFLFLLLLFLACGAAAVASVACAADPAAGAGVVLLLLLLLATAWLVPVTSSTVNFLVALTTKRSPILSREPPPTHPRNGDAPFVSSLFFAQRYLQRYLSVIMATRVLSSMARMLRPETACTAHRSAARAHPALFYTAGGLHRACLQRYTSTETAPANKSGKRTHWPIKMPSISEVKVLLS